MKIKSKTLFLILMFSFIIPLYRLNSVNANLEYFPILASSLNISLTPVTTRDSHYNIEISEVAVTKFTNLGIFGEVTNPLGQQAANNEILYYADVEATIIFNLLSFFDVTNADRTRRTGYFGTDTLWLNLWTTNNYYEWLESLKYQYYVHTEEFQFDYMKIESTSVKLEVTYTPLNEKYLSFLGRNITASIPPTDAYFESVVAGYSFSGEIAQYDVKFINIDADIKMEANDFRTDETKPGMLNEGQGAFDNKISSLHVGVFPEGITQTPLQAKEIDGLTKGNTNFGVIQGSTLQANLPLRLDPEIIEYKQKIEVGQLDHISIIMKDAWWLFQDAGIYHTSPVKTFQIYENGRTVGIKINNYYIQQEIHIKFKLFSILQLDVPITQAILGIPEIQRGDFIWDLAITGDTGATIILTEQTFNPLAFFDEFGDIIGWIIGLIFLGVAAYVTIKATPLITRGIKAKQDRDERKVSNERRVSKK